MKNKFSFKSVLVISRVLSISLLAWVLSTSIVQALNSPNSSNGSNNDTRCAFIVIGSDGKASLNKNCAQVNSCTKNAGRCLTIRGGSQYVYNNRAPACLDPRAKPCVQVECKIVDFVTYDCTEDPINVAINPSKGCREGVRY